MPPVLFSLPVGKQSDNSLSAFRHRTEFPEDFQGARMNRNGKRKGAVAALKRKRAGKTLLNDRAIIGRKRTEEALRESEKQYRQLFENSMLAISQTSLEGRLVRVNPAYARMYGYASPEQMIAEVTDIEHQLYADPADRKEVLRILSKKGVVGPREITVIRRDGTRFNVEVLAQEIRDVSGRLFCYQASHVDITERKQTVAALLESDERFRMVYERAAIGIAITDVQGRILQTNAYFQRMLGCPSEDLVGRTTAEFTFPAEVETERALFQQAMNEGRTDVLIQKRYVRNDGQIIWANLTISICRNSSGQPQFVIGLVEDITARKLAETQIRDFSRKLLAVREEEKRHFSAVLHHDVGSCTVGVTARLLAAEEDLRQGKCREALASLREGRRLFVQSARRLKTLAAELRPPDLDILGLPAALRQHFSLLTKETSLRIHFTDATYGMAIPPETQTVLFRIVQESLNNVVKHARARQVRVQLSAPRKTLRLSIVDDGKGFDPVRVAAKPGARLGLRIAQELVAALGGEFVVNASSGRGTTVLVTMPRGGPKP
jgi:PAS domain S-box-containing protein